MKVRHGFVTNSSSSSYIVSSKGQFNDVDSVFRLIVGLYKELHTLADKAMKELIDKGLFEPGDDYINKYKYNTPGRKLVDSILDEHGLDGVYDLNYYLSWEIPGWCNLSTYKEYLEWTDNENGGDRSKLAIRPFTLVDTSDSEIEDKENIAVIDDCFDWYTDSDSCGIIPTEKTEIKCCECRYNQVCKGNDHNRCLIDTPAPMEERKFDRYAKKEAMHRFGSIIVYCDEGFNLPYYIRDSLSCICDHYCGHMG